MPEQSQHQTPEVPQQTPEVTDEDDDITDSRVGEELAATVRNGSDTLKMTQYTETSGLGVHNHAPASSDGTAKHDVREAFNVREEFIVEHFTNGIVPNGHEAVHALLAGRESFIAAEEPIFEDVADDNDRRWARIRDTAEDAHIPPHRKAELQSLYR